MPETTPPAPPAHDSGKASPHVGSLGLLRTCRSRLFRAWHRTKGEAVIGSLMHKRSVSSPRGERERDDFFPFY